MHKTDKGFNKMIKFLWKKKERLNEQLNFFNAKKKRFVSVYASKPRIRIKVVAEYDSKMLVLGLSGTLGCQATDDAVSYLKNQSGLAQAQDLRLSGLAQHQSTFVAGLAQLQSVYSGLTQGQAMAQNQLIANLGFSN